MMNDEQEENRGNGLAMNDETRFFLFIIHHS